MKLYQVTVEVTKEDDEGNSMSFTVQKFAGSMSEVSAVKNEFVAEHGVKRKDCESNEVDVPTNKTGLLVFLNELVA